MIKLLLAMALVSILGANAAAQEHIQILATGGTIAGKSLPSSGYTSGALPIDTLIAAIPEIEGYAKISWQQVASIGSQDMNISVWKNLYRAIDKAKKDEKITAIVVTHGTDTLVDSAFLFDLLFPSGKPLIFVGAMRPADHRSADGPQNLLDAVAVAASAEASHRGALIVMDSNILEARNAFKQHTESLGTFKPTNGGFAGELVKNEVVFFHPPVRGNDAESLFGIADIDRIADVSVMAVYPALSSQHYKDALALVGKGLVIAGVGNGNFPSSMHGYLTQYVDAGGIVVRASQVPMGHVSRNIEVDDDRLGSVASLGLSPPKARILLALLLNKNMPPRQLQNAFSCQIPTATKTCGEAQRATK
jgi:L-asparaginase